jgi:hypothetical protein
MFLPFGVGGFSFSVAAMGAYNTSAENLIRGQKPCRALSHLLSGSQKRVRTRYCLRTVASAIAA